MANVHKYLPEDIKGRLEALKESRRKGLIDPAQAAEERKKLHPCNIHLERNQSTHTIQCQGWSGLEVEMPRMIWDGGYWEGWIGGVFNESYHKTYFRFPNHINPQKNAERCLREMLKIFKDMRSGKLTRCRRPYTD